MADAGDVKAAEIPVPLLTDIKTYLNITWEDTKTDSEVSDFIRDGMFYLDDKLGEAGDYLVPGYPRTLLKEYVRYARDKALDVYENNYRSMLTAMQNNRRVSGYVESAEQTG